MDLHVILAYGLTSESDVVIKHKVKVIFQKIQNLKQSAYTYIPIHLYIFFMSAAYRRKTPGRVDERKSELERKMAELQSALQAERRDSVCNSDPALKAELESCLDENLALQEMLDRKKKELNETQSELTQLRMDRENAEARARDMEDQLAELQDELRREGGSKTLKQKLEEVLRQRERELTALKGALKEEVASHDKEVEVLREQYSTDMEKLRSSMEQVSQSHAGIESERLRVNVSIRSLQQQLEDCRDESSHWMEQFHATRDELRTTKQELLQIRLEKEEFEEELKEVQDKVSTMKQQKPDTGHTQTLSQELQRHKDDLQKAKSEVEKQRTAHDKKVMEVISIKKSHQGQEAELKYEIDRLKDQLQKAREDVAKAQEKNKKAQLQNNASESSEAEIALHSEVRGLRSELEEANRKSSRLSQEIRELVLRVEDTEKDKETLKQTFSQLEETKRQQERALEKLNREYETLTVSSKEEAQILRVQLEEQREKARKEVQETQRHGKDAQSELERSQINLRRLEEEDKLKRVELELEEERSSGDDDGTSGPEQRSDRSAALRAHAGEILQAGPGAGQEHHGETPEGAEECVADMEGQSRSSAGVSQLESKIQELEEQQRTEESGVWSGN
ncbi:hypothetical protein F7725_018456 [Dissostichus mawsoni]|uniref:Uncharacterized protein n=1 Tax=Dissostichus mawsoni TaxID=36200 RepID=A0A7J5XT57_DISMA|nr:hypothetical protein F7725_018456 [Dissostichus mawsoni]